MRRSGDVLEIGSDRQRPYELRSTSNITRAIVQLYEAERVEFISLVSELSKVMRTLAISPESVWIEPVDSSSGRQIEVSLDLTVSIEGYSQADLVFISTDNSSTQAVIVLCVH